MLVLVGRALSYDRGSLAAGERGWNYFNVVKDFRTENGSNQGQNLALTG